MGINARGSDSFLETIGRSFPIQDVVVVSDRGGETKRTELRAHVQSEKAMFEIDAPVYEGDAIELDDPRGGTRTVYITDVKLNDVRGSAGFKGMSHSVVSFSTSAPVKQSSTPRSQVFNGPVVMVSGGQANVAWDGGTVNSKVEAITAGYEELAAHVAKALEVIAAADVIDPDDAALGNEVGQEVLAEVVKPDPDKGVIKRGLAALRGVLSAAATGASSETAKQLIQQLFA